MSGLLIPGRGRRAALPKAPPEIEEAVILWGRQQNRVATLHYVPFGGWFVNLELKPNDPAMLAYQRGSADKPPTEKVFFHVSNPKAGQIKPGTGDVEPEFLQLDILQLGVSGVRTFLEKGNTWSGRGKFKSLQHALKYAREKNEQKRHETRAKAKIDNRLRQRETRRSRLKIPFLPVGKDLKSTD